MSESIELNFSISTKSTLDILNVSYAEFVSEFVPGFFCMEHKKWIKTARIKGEREREKNGCLY